MVAEQGTRTADIVAESLLDWGVDVIFGLPGDGFTNSTGRVVYPADQRRLGR